jgi:hypothetical protein
MKRAAMPTDFTMPEKVKIKLPKTAPIRRIAANFTSPAQRLLLAPDEKAIFPLRAGH